MSRKKEDLEKVARLARLELADDELTQLGEQVERILGYVRKLEEVDVTGVLPTKHVLERTDVLRDDRSRPSLDRELTLAEAPDSDHGQFVVPAVMPE